MNNVIFYDGASIIVVIILLIVLLLKKNIESRSNHILMFMMIVTLLSSVGDILAALAENSANHTQSMITFAYAANYLYFFAHNMLFPLFVMYIYASLDIWYRFESRGVRRVLWVTAVNVIYLILLSNPFNQLVFTISPTVEYIRGPLISALYAGVAFFAIWGCGVVIYNRNILSKSKLNVLLVIVCVIIGALLIQLFFPTILVENFAVVMSMLFFMIVIHRDENPVDPATGAMKYHRALDRVTVAMQVKKPFIAIFIKLTNNKNIQLYLGQDRFVKYLNEQSEAIAAIAKSMNYRVDIYYLENGSFGLFVDDPDREKAMEFANALYKNYENKCEIDHLAILPEVCICVVHSPEDVSDPYKLVSLSTTFYETLGVKKGVICYADYIKSKDFMIRNELDPILKKALKERRFEVYFQPIYSTIENRFVSAEALIRLRDEKYGYISPALFIPVAEERGLIHEIGDYVFQEVLRFISENDMKALNLDFMQINVSAAQCIEADLVPKIKRWLEEYNVAPEMIRMELTETIADVNPAMVDKNILELSELGITFSLDDYGTGYSNIRRVTTIPFRQVKLDKSFVEEIDNPVMWSVIRDTITMFKEMGMEILVEGIESEEVAKRFVDFKIDLVEGCEFMQGFFFCRPMPEVEFIEYIKANINRKVINS